MTFSKVTRYCAPPDVVRLLERDGLGWGHDLQCGVFVLPSPRRKGEKK